MLKKLLAVIFSLMLFLPCTTEAAPPQWSTEGLLAGTEISYSAMAVGKSGLSVKFTNTSHSTLKISSRLTFYDKNMDKVGYSLFGVREIPAGESVEFFNNHITGDWKKCKSAFKTEWETMTYEQVY